MAETPTRDPAETPERPPTPRSSIRTRAAQRVARNPGDTKRLLGAIAVGVGIVIGSLWVPSWGSTLVALPFAGFAAAWVAGRHPVLIGVSLGGMAAFTGAVLILMSRTHVRHPLAPLVELHEFLAGAALLLGPVAGALMASHLVKLPAAKKLLAQVGAGSALIGIAVLEQQDLELHIPTPTVQIEAASGPADAVTVQARCDGPGWLRIAVVGSAGSYTQSEFEPISETSEWTWESALMDESASAFNGFATPGNDEFAHVFLVGVGGKEHPVLMKYFDQLIEDLPLDRPIEPAKLERLRGQDRALSYRFVALR